ncbi:polysaccharide lyase family 8 protein [Tulasnella calospora MUT 4182]|uniref:Polysaccharide lyase family 8 protein n=1 Tax=Tulasnella calospora MUT 4182 TaxID=1051891 RepID=A0A0C3QIE4_9AGAM|nr:polysaccharide lyase family 8 protein [Tulasnella calospora MUT 4182]
MKLPGATSAAGAALLSLFATTTLIPAVKANNNSTNSTSTSSVHDDIQTLFRQKISYIVDTLTGKNSGSITKYLDTEQPNGQFTDVNYASGCNAQRSNWPAQQHWTRLRPIAAAYSDLVPHSSSLSQKPPKQFSNNATVKQDLDLAMNWWFSNDFNETSCLDKGGLSHPGTCPCSTPGMWNPNWFANVISIPQLSGEACLLYNSTLTTAQRTSCVSIGDRAYVPPSTNVTGIGVLTGANALDLAYVGVSTGLLKYVGGMGGGAEQVADAYRRTHDELVIKTGLRQDGIQPDGSFSQHEGILYNGNYGKDYTSSVLSLELPAAGTQYEGGDTTKEAFGKHVDGFQWMIYGNNATSVLHWDLSTVGRMISYAVVDNQATANLKLNLSLVQELGEMWEASAITDATYCLLKNDTFSNANVNELVGNRMFWSNDYMVHRGQNYVSTLKMVSTRTTNTECLNGQNMKGFHLGQGVVFNYVSGTEYEDVAGAWDWNLIPGTTTAYGATPLTCDQTEWDGKESFVGGASNGKVGVAAMKWTHAMRADILAYQKAWFFFEGGVHHVLVPGVQSAAGAPVYSVLDQKRHNATGIYVDGQLLSATNSSSGHYSSIHSLWYGGVGYAFDTSATGRGCASVNLKTGLQTGKWADIGTSSAGNASVDMFSAWIQHDSSALSEPVSYSVYPGTKSQAEFEAKANNRTITVVRNDVAASAVLDAESQTLMAVFWGAGNVTIPAGLAEGENTNGTFVIASNSPVTLVLDLVSGIGAVADPTQSLGSVTLTIGTPPSPVGAQQLTNDGGADQELQFGTITVALPQGRDAGRSIEVDFNGRNAAGSELHAKEKKKRVQRYKLKRKQHQG